jgi:hypothetical protein
MLAPAEASASPRIRCRQIGEGDLETLADFLAEGFPERTRDYWETGLARLATLPPVEGMARFGYVLESEQGIVGVLLILSSRRGDQIIANVSSWYVRPSHRAHSALLVSMATKLKHVIYLNASPAPHTWQTLQATGWKAYNFGRSAVAPILGFGGGKVSEAIPADLPDRVLLEGHRTFGCISLVCEKDGKYAPFVFKPRRLARPPLPILELIYCRQTAEFVRCGAALGRHFLKQGYLGFLADGKIAGPLSHYSENKEPRFYKGPRAPELNDLAYTEKVIFG